MFTIMVAQAAFHCRWRARKRGLSLSRV